MEDGADEAASRVSELIHGATSGDLATVERLVESWPGLLSEQKARDFATCYWAAWKADRNEVCGFLMRKKYDQSEDQIKTAVKLSEIVRSGDVVKLKKKLSEQNCNWRDWKGRTPIMWSAAGSTRIFKDDLDCLKLLLSSGVDIGAADLDGNTALHLAAAAGRLPVIRRLIREGASLDVKNLSGATPLMEAEKTGCLEAQKILREPELANLDEQQLCDSITDEGSQQPSSSDGWETFSNTTAMSSSADREEPLEETKELPEEIKELTEIRGIRGFPWDPPKGPAVKLILEPMETAMMKFMEDELGTTFVQRGTCVRLLHAADGELWNEVLNKMETADDTVKAICCPGLIATAARLSNWAIVEQLLNEVVNMEHKDLCSLVVAFYASQEANWDLLRAVVSNITDENIKKLCFAVAAPYAAESSTYASEQPSQPADIINELQKLFPGWNAKADEGCLASVLQASRALQWDVVRGFLRVVTSPESEYICCMTAAFYAAKIERWDLSLEFMKIFKKMLPALCYLVPDLCYLAVIQHAATVNDWDLVQGFIADIRNSSMKNLACSMIFSKATLASSFKTVTTCLEQIFLRYGQDSATFEILFGTCHKVLNEISFSKVMDLSELNELIVALDEQHFMEAICSFCNKPQSKYSSLKELRQFVMQSTDAAVMRSILRGAKPSQWNDTKQARLLQLKGTLLGDLFCLSSVRYAVDQKLWNLANKLTSIVRDSSIKDTCFLLAIQKAAKEQQWHLIEKLLPFLQDSSVHDWCCLNAANNAVDAHQLSLAKEITSKMRDKRINESFEELDNEIITDIRYQWHEGTTRNLDQLELLEVLVREALDEAESTVKDYLCLSEILPKCEEGDWKQIEQDLLSLTNKQIKNVCILTVFPFAVQPSQCGLPLDEILQHISDIAIRLICFKLAYENRHRMNHLGTQALNLLFTTQRAVTIKIFNDILQLEKTRHATEDSIKILAEQIKGTEYEELALHWLIFLATDFEMWYSALDIIQQIADPETRDLHRFYIVKEFCQRSIAKATITDAALHILESIEDENAKDICCLLVSPIAVRTKMIPLFQQVLNYMTNAAGKRLCIKAAVGAASQTYQWSEVRWILETGRDHQMYQNFCCMQSYGDVLVPAARTGQWDLVSQMIEVVLNESTTCCLPHIRNNLQAALSYAAGASQWDIVMRIICLVRDASTTTLTTLPQTLQKLFDAAAPYATTFSRCKELCLRISLRTSHLDIWELLGGILSMNIVKDLCYLAAAPCTAQDDWNELENLLNTVTNPCIKDLCHLHAAPFAAKKLEWRLVKKFIESASNAAVKDLICEAVLRPALDAEEIDFAEFLLNSIANRVIYETCCTEVAPHSAKAANWKLTDRICHTVTNPKRKDLCIKHSVTFALEAGEWDLVSELLPDIQGKRIRDACHVDTISCAGKASKWDLVFTMLENVKDDEVKNRCRESVVIHAAQQNQWNVVTSFIKQTSDNTVTDRCCESIAVSAAVAQEWTFIMEILIPSLNDTATTDKCLHQLISYAADANQWPIVNHILQEIKNWTLKHTCCSEIASRVFSMLDSPNTDDVLMTALQCISEENMKFSIITNAFCVAIKFGRKDLISKLFDHGLEPDMEEPHSLNLLASLNHISLYDFAATFNQKLQYRFYETLFRCIREGHVSLAFAFLKNCENIDWRDGSGTSVLTLASEKGHLDLVKECIQQHAEIHLQDDNGFTAVTRACNAEQKSTVAFLIKHANATPQHRDEEKCLCRSVQLFDHQSRDTDMDNCGTLPNNLIDNHATDARLSTGISDLLTSADFTADGAARQCVKADRLQSIARELAQDGRHITGSFADGWGNSLTTADGRTAPDSDIDWTIILAEDDIKHLDGGCQCSDSVELLKVKEGHAIMEVQAGNQPAVSVSACGFKPAQDICYAYRCCSTFREDRIRLLLPDATDDSLIVHLVRATRPDCPNDLRISFSFQEKKIMRGLTTVQGQLYVLLKFAFKRLLPKMWNVQGLKTYHAKTLLFFMLDRYSKKSEIWMPENLILLLKESLDLMIICLKENDSPDVCMEHFFVPQAPLHLKNAGTEATPGQVKKIIIANLKRLRGDLTPLLELVTSHVRPRKSDKTFFQPFALLPNEHLVPIELDREIIVAEEMTDAMIYRLVYSCFMQLPILTRENDNIFRKKLDHLRKSASASSVATCLHAMSCVKLNDLDGAKMLIKGFQWGDEFYRFSFPCVEQPDFAFLPPSTRSIVRSRTYKDAIMLQVNFRCLLWALQAEFTPAEGLLWNREWRKQVGDDPDVEELHTLAKNNLCPELARSLSTQMDKLADERGSKNLDEIDTEKIVTVMSRAVWTSQAWMVILTIILLSGSYILDCTCDIFARGRQFLWTVTVFILAALYAVELLLHIRFIFNKRTRICLSKYSGRTRSLLCLFLLIGALALSIYFYFFTMENILKKTR